MEGHRGIQRLSLAGQAGMNGIYGVGLIRTMLKQIEMSDLRKIYKHTWVEEQEVHLCSMDPRCLLDFCRNITTKESQDQKWKRS